MTRLFLKYFFISAFAIGITVLTGTVVLAAYDFVSAGAAGPANVNDPGHCYAAAWGDYDNDGDLDLYIGNNGTNYLFRNQGNGSFERVSGVVPADAYDTRAAIWGDYDNDGDLDLYIVNSGSVNRLFRNKSNNTFVEITSGSFRDSGQGRAASWVDIDNDGDLDLYLGNYGGYNRLYLNNGNGTFSSNVAGTAGVASTSTSNTNACAWGDFDNDGDIDLYITNYGQQNELYLNDGDGTFTAKGAQYGVKDTGLGYGCAWGDYNNDGYLDLFVANFGQAAKLYRNMNGTGFSEESVTANVADSGYNSACAWGDYNNDGYLDLFIANVGYPDKLYLNRGDGTFEENGVTANVNSSSQARAVAWGDYDNDGDLDLYVGVVSGENVLYKNQGGTNNFARIRLTGRSANHFGIGARVALVAGGVTRTIEISGGNGFCSSGPQEAHFGLGNAASITSVTVDWPTNPIITKVFNTAVSDRVNKTTVLSESFFEDYGVGGISSMAVGRGVAWGDYNNDGHLDLYLVNNGAPNMLFVNDGAGGFSDVAGNAGYYVDDDGAGSSAVWGDYNNDGYLDLYVANEGGENRLYKNNSGNGFTSVLSDVWPDADSSRGCAWGDYNNDGWLDLYVVNNGTNYLYRNTGTSFVSASSDGGNGYGCAWGDYNNDGWLDLYVANQGVNRLYKNTNGTLGLVQTAASQASDSSRGCAWGDYDNDGDLDLYVVNAAGSSTMYRNDGSDVFTERAVTAGVNVIGNSCSWGDYDNDGWLDLYVVGNGANKLFLNLRNGTFAEIGQSAEVAHTGDGYGCAWGDYDNDGYLDLYIANNQQNILYHNLSGSNSYAFVKLYGSASNRWGIGARLVLTADDVTYRRDISGSSGYCAQGAPVAHFGLGANTALSSIAVTWKTGRTDTYDVQITDKINQTISLAENYFVDKTAALGIQQDANTNYASAWADYNGDGRLDLAVIDYREVQTTKYRTVYVWGVGNVRYYYTYRYNYIRLYTQQANGTFALSYLYNGSLYRDTYVYPNSEPYFYSLAWGDYDNDGDLDLFVGGTNLSYNMLFKNNNGSISNSDVASSAGVQGTLTNYACSAAWGDYDNDGLLDLYVSGTGSNTLYRNKGDNTFENLATYAGVADANSGGGCAWADYDNDGDLDLFVANNTATDATRLYRNKGDGKFENKWGSAGGIGLSGYGSNSQALSGAWGDYDNDGDLDLYVVFVNQNNKLFRNNGNGSFTLIDKGVAGGGSAHRCTWIDYDNDGWLDLYLSTGKLYRNNRGQSFTEIGGTSAGIGSGYGGAWGDYDRDGYLDLFIDKTLYRNPGGGNNYLNIKLSGSSASKTGIGTWVSVVADGVTRSAMLSGGSGYCGGQDEPVAHIGLGTATGIDSLNVHWISNPSHTQTLTSIAGINRTITVAENTFAEVAASKMVASGDSCNGAMWGDYDNDGDWDLYLARDGFNQLYRQGANGTFTDAVNAGPGTLVNLDTRACAWGDYNNDGYLDVYIVNNGANNILYKGTESFNFIEDSDAHVNYAGPGRACAWADYDRDGDLDLYVVNTGTANRLYRNNGKDIGIYNFSEVGSAAGVAHTGNGQGCAWGDFDNDGDLDLYVANNGANVLYRNDGGSFTSVYAGTVAGNADSRSAVWVDYNNDTYLDLYVINNGPNVLYQNNNGTGFSVAAVSGSLAGNDDSNSAVWGDIDNDRDLDLYVANNGSNKFYRNNGGTFTEQADLQQVQGNGNSRSATMVDVDNDGFLDIYVANTDQQNQLYLNMEKPKSTNRFVKVRLHGIAANSNAIGTKIGIKAGGVSRNIEVGSPGVYPSAKPGVHFGLGSAGSIDAMSVCWLTSPNHTDVYTTGISDYINKTVAVTENVFVEAGTDSGLEFAASGAGCAWADYDNDGYYDVYVYGNTTNVLYRNKGDGSFEAVDAGVGDTADTRGAAWGDFDNDGYMELYVANWNAAGKLYDYDPEQRTFTNVATHAQVGITGPYTQCAWVDYNGDGNLDLYLVSYEAIYPNVLFKNNGDNTFSQTGQAADPGCGKACAWGDYDNDGDQDLYVVNYNQANRFFRNKGNGTFEEIAESLRINDQGPGSSCAWGDYNNDGRLELYVTNEGQANLLYVYNEGTNKFDNFAAVAQVSDSGNGKSCAWGDLDNDGDLDLYVANQGGNKLYRYNAATGKFSDIGTDMVVGGSDTSAGCAWVDANNDGYLDIFVVNNGQSLRLYQNPGGLNNYVAVTLKGVASNHNCAIGGRVTLIAGGVTQNREISGGGGSQGPPEARFGLAGSTSVTSLSVQWPLTPLHTDSYTGVVANQIRSLKERQFADSAQAALINASGDNRSAAWADYDRDGDLDLFVTDYIAANRNKLFIYDSVSGTFASQNVGRESSQDCVGVWGDYDNDGWLDLFIGGSGENQLLHNESDGESRVLVPGPAIPKPSSGVVYGAAWGDYDNDGDLDLFVSKAGYNALYRNNGNGTFDNVAGDAGVSDLSANTGLGCSWADYDNDGWLDLFVSNSTAADYTRLYRNKGDGTFENKWGISGLSGYGTNSNSISGAWGDYDNDGDLDLYVVFANQPNKLFRNNGGVFEEIMGAAGMAEAGAAYRCAWIDYDNDGWLDLYLSTGKIYKNNNGTSFTDITDEVNISSSLSGAWADYNSDGYPDLYAVRSGINSLHRNVGGYNDNYVRMNLHGIASNGSGYGARISLRANNVTRSIEIDGGSGCYGSQDALPPHFGLGRNDSIQALTVRWLTDPPHIESYPTEMNQQNGHVISITENMFSLNSASLALSGAWNDAAWGDYDNDGDYDMYLVGNGLNGLYKNKADGTFEIVNLELRDNGDGRAAAWADYDNDGDLDLYVVNNGGANQLFTNVYDSTGIHYYNAVELDVNNGPGRDCAWIDYDNDGDLDLYVVNYGDANALFENSNGVFTNSGKANDTGNGQGCAWGDFDGDGDLDLYIANNGANVLCRNDGGSFVSVQAETVAGNDNSRSATWIDYDNDGDLDLYVVNNGSNVLYVNEDGNLSPLTAGIEDTGDGYGAVWGDIDNDRDLDLYVVNNGSNRLYRNNGGSFSETSSQDRVTGNASSRSATWIDYDNDGDLDLYVINNNQPNRLYRNLYMRNNHTTIKLSSIAANPMAIGARVSVKAGGVTRNIEVVGEPGARGGLHIGLGDNESVQAVAVTWPTTPNHTSVLTIGLDTCVNGMLVITENVFPDDAPVTGLNDAGAGRMAAWADYNNDGYLDLFVVNKGPGQLNRLYRNADGVFTTVNAGVDGSGASTAASWIDYNRDGFADLYLINEGAANILYRNDSGQGFSPVAGSGLEEAGNGRGCAWADYDNDGNIDVYLINDNGCKLYRNVGNGEFEPAPGAGLDLISSTVRDAVWGDYDNDGDLDLYVVRSGEANILYRNAAGSFSSTGLLADAGNGRAARWFDYDNDGDLDLFVVNNNGSNKLFSNNYPLNSFIDMTLIWPGVFNSTSGSDCAILDYDNDGFWDIYVVNDGQPNKLYRNNAASSFVDVAADQQLSYSGSIAAAVADYNNDGWQDIYLVNPEGENRLYRNPTGYGNYCKVLLQGVAVNRSAIGARLSLKSGGVTRNIELNGDQAMVSGSMIEAHFGLGAATSVDSLQVRWLTSPNHTEVFSTVGTNRANTYMEKAFLDIAAAKGVNHSGATYTSAWIDYDNDGDLDLFVTRIDGPNTLYRNDGDGIFCQQELGSASSTCAWGDYDNDGDLDVFLAHHSVASCQLLENDKGVFTNVIGQTGITSEMYIYGAAWADYDNDGHLDLYVSRYNADNRLYRNNGNKSFSNEAGNAGVSISGTNVNRNYGCAWGDYNNDGYPDLYVSYDYASGDYTRLFKNNKNGTFTDIWRTLGLSGYVSNGQSRSAAWGDYDNDGDLDLYVVFVNQANKLFRNIDGESFEAIVPEGGIDTAGNTNHCQWVDYDNDGYLDLYLANGKLFRNIKGEKFEEVGTGLSITSGVSGTWGDFDGNGYQDLYVARSNGANSLYSNMGGYNNYLRVKLNPMAANKSAIGARIYVKAGGVTANAFISGGSGTYTSQSELTAHIGLGNAAVIDSMFVYWPKKTTEPDVFTTELTGKVNSTIVINEQAMEELGSRLGVNSSDHGTSGTWCDYNNDGIPELYVTNTGTANIFYRYDAQLKRFTNGAQSLGVNDGSESRNSTWCDYDSDSDLDLYVINNGANKLYRNNLSGFSEDTEAGLGDSGNGNAAAWGDYDNDGDMDVYIANHGENKLYTNNNGRFVPMDAGFGVNDSSESHGCSWVDYDSDGDPDLYVANNGLNRFYVNEGMGLFSESAVTLSIAGNVDENSYGCAWGDFDNDGDFDLYVANWGTGNRLYVNDGHGGFTDETAARGVTDNSNSYSCSWIDYDNDGDLDLYVSNDGDNRLFKNTNGTFVDVAGKEGVANANTGKGCVWGDYDSDGYPDLYVVNDGQPNALYRRPTGYNKYVRIRLVGRNGAINPSGALIQVKAGGVTRSVQVNSTNGFGGQNDPLTHIGLGGATAIESITVRWPDNPSRPDVYTYIDNASVLNHTITITENMVFASRASGSWSSPGTWTSIIGPPGPNNELSINSGHTVTYGNNASTINISTINIKAGGTLAFLNDGATHNINVDGSIIVAGSLVMTRNSVIRIRSDASTPNGMRGIIVRSGGYLEAIGSQPTASADIEITSCDTNGIKVVLETGATARLTNVRFSSIGQLFDNMPVGEYTGFYGYAGSTIRLDGVHFPAGQPIVLYSNGVHVENSYLSRELYLYGNSNTVRNNHIGLYDKTAAIILGGSGSLIENNRIESELSPSQYGVRISGDSTVVSGNRIYGFRTRAVSVEGADVVTIRGNTLYDNDGTAVYISDASSVQVTGNTISDSGVGITVTANASALIIGSNSLSSLTGSGITVQGSQGIAIQSITMEGNGGYGLCLRNSSKVTVNSVALRQNMLDAVRIEDSRAVTISSVTVTGNSANGLSAVSASVLVVSGCEFGDPILMQDSAFTMSNSVFQDYLVVSRNRGASVVTSCTFNATAQAGRNILMQNGQEVITFKDCVIGDSNNPSVFSDILFQDTVTSSRVVAQNVRFLSPVTVTGSISTTGSDYLISFRHNGLAGKTCIWGDYVQPYSYNNSFSFAPPSYFGAGDDNTRKVIIVDGRGSITVPAGRLMSVIGVSGNATVFANGYEGFDHEESGYYDFRIYGKLEADYVDFRHVGTSGVELLKGCTIGKFNNVQHLDRANGSIQLTVQQPAQIENSPFIDNFFDTLDGGYDVKADNASVYFDTRSVNKRGCEQDIEINGGHVYWGGGTFETSLDGNWSSSSTWKQGYTPGVLDKISIKNNVVYDLDSNTSITCLALTIATGKQLRFADASSPREMIVSGDIQVNGALVMTANSVLKIAGSESGQYGLNVNAGGRLEVVGQSPTTRNAIVTAYNIARKPYVMATRNCDTIIRNAEISYLGMKGLEKKNGFKITQTNNNETYKTRISNTDFHHNYVGLYLDRVQNAEITGNRFYNNTYGVKMLQGRTLTLRNNQYYGNTSAGILMGDSTGLVADNETFSSGNANIDADIYVLDSLTSSTGKFSNSRFLSNNPVKGINYLAFPGQKIISRSHNRQKGVTAIWGRYAVPVGQICKFNVSENTTIDGITDDDAGYQKVIKLGSGSIIEVPANAVFELKGSATTPSVLTNDTETDDHRYRFLIGGTFRAEHFTARFMDSTGIEVQQYAQSVVLTDGIFDFPMPGGTYLSLKNYRGTFYNLEFKPGNNDPYNVKALQGAETFFINCIAGNVRDGAPHNYQDDTSRIIWGIINAELVNVNNLLTSSKDQGSTNVPCVRFGVKTDGDVCALSGLQVQLAGDIGFNHVNLKLYKETSGNSETLEPTKDALVATGYFSQERVCNLSFATQQISDAPAYYYLALNVLDIATPGTSFGLTIPSTNSLIVDGYSTVSPVHFPVQSGVVSVNVYPTTVFVSGNNQVETEYIKQDSRNVAMLKVMLRTDDHTAVWRGVTIRGAVNSQININRVRIYRESGSAPGYQENSDFLCGTGAFVNNVAPISFTTEQAVTTVTKSYYVVYDIEPEAVSGNILRAGIRYMSDYTFVAPAALDEERFVSISSTEARVRMTNDKVIVMPEYASIQESVTQGDTGVPIAKLGFRMAEHTAALQGLALRKIGTLSSEHVSNLKIYKDIDRNGSFSPTADAQVSEDSVDFADGKWRFIVDNQLITTTPNLYFVVGDISIDAPVGEAVGVDIAATGDVEVAAPDYVEVTGEPGKEVYVTPYPSVITVAGIDNAGIPPEIVMMGQRNIHIKSFMIRTDRARVNWNSLTLKLIGSATHADIDGLRLYRDINNGTYDHNDQVIASANAYGPTKVCQLQMKSGTEEVGSSWQYYHIVYDISEDAEADHTFGVEISSLGAFAFDIGYGAVTGNVPVTSNLGCVAASPSEVSVRRLTNAISEVRQGDTGKQLMRIGLVTDRHEAYLERLRLSYTGTNENNIRNLRIYFDTNGSGAYEVADERISTAGYRFTQGVVDIPLLHDLEVTDEEKSIFVVGDIDINSVSGNTIQINIPQNIYMQLDPSGGDYVSEAGFPIAGPVITIKPTIDKINITGRGSAPIVITQGERNVVFKTLEVQVDAGAQGYSGVMNEIRISKIGTLSDDAVSNIILWLDNADSTRNVGEFNPSDDIRVTKGTNRFVQGVCPLVIEEAGQTLSKTKKTYFLTMDISETASANNTVGFQIASAASVRVSEPDYVSTFNTSISSGTSKVWKKKAIVSLDSRDLTIKGINQGTGGVPMLELNVHADYWYSYITKVTIKQTGSLETNMVNKVYLYERTASVEDYVKDDTQTMRYIDEGVFDDLGNVILGFDGDGDRIQAGTTRNYVIYIDINAEAVPSRTVGLRLASEANIELRDGTIYGWDTVSSENMPIYTNTMLVYNRYKPTKPKIVMNDYVGSFGRVQLAWNSTAENGIREVIFALGTEPGKADILPWSLADGGVPDLDVTGMNFQHGGTYYLTIRTRSLNDQGLYVESDETVKKFTVDGTLPEIAPSINTRLFVDRTSVALNWLPAGEDMSEIIAYEIQEKEGFLPTWHTVRILLKERLKVGGSYTILNNRDNDVYMINSYGKIYAATENVIEQVADLPTYYRFDNRKSDGTYYYRMRAQNSAGSWSEFTTASNPVVLGTQSELIYNLVIFPNPFDSRKNDVKIGYGLRENANIRIRIYTPFGALVKEFSYTAGENGGRAGEVENNITEWDGKNSEGKSVAKGGYIVVVEASTANETKIIKDIIGVIH